MTACVNKHSKRVAAVISASLVGALSLGVAVPAFAAEGDIDLQAEDLSTVWESTEFTWNVQPEKDGSLKVTTGDQLILKSAKNVNGPVGLSDLTVVYFQDTNGDGKVDSTEDVWNSTPEPVGDYTVLVLDGVVDTSDWNNGTDAGFYADIINSKPSHAFKLSVEAKSLKGSYAYQGEDKNDRSFMYTGFDLRDGNKNDIHIADAEGNQLDVPTSGVTVTITDAAGNDVTNGGVKDAGIYTVSLKADDDRSSYADSWSFTFTVDKINLADATVSVDPLEPVAGNFDEAVLQQSKSGAKVYVNGEQVDTDVLYITAATVEVINPGDLNDSNNGTYPGNRFDGSWRAKVNAIATPGYGKTANFVGSTQKPFTFYVVSDVLKKDADFKLLYDQENVNGTLYFETAKGESFNPDLITVEGIGAYDQDEYFKSISVTVTKDGKAVTDYSEPGTYSVRVDIDVPDDLAYAGSETFNVVVVAKRYSAQPKAWATVDGKDVASAIEYDGDAVTPVVTVKDGSAVLTEGEDYTVTYTDASGETVTEMVEPGVYTGTIDFGEATYYQSGDAKKVQPIVFSFEITKAEIESAKADKDVYAYTGEAVTPIFTAWTNKDFSGLSLEIDPSVVGVNYYEVKFDEGMPWTDADDKWVEVDGPVTAAGLKDEGYYVAKLVVPADDAHFYGEVTSEPFQISSYAAYSDVAADAWYAESVYDAAKLGYMTGISGTDLFMPESNITRAQLAQVFANMAGHTDQTLNTPSKFDDVDSWAWYAEAVAWASEAGIVTGYDDTTFGPMDNATREQVAVMLYRYAKGQGKDVTVEDADETLAAYKDGSEVSDWAKDAMAWAVENGIFGVDTDELWAQENIQRAAVATIAVRFQPEALPEA